MLKGNDFVILSSKEVEGICKALDEKRSSRKGIEELIELRILDTIDQMREFLHDPLSDF